MALEIKQIRSPASCINGMLKDIKKLAKIRKADFDIRGVLCLGVHNTIRPEEVLREVDYYAKKINIDIKQAHVFSERIGNTGFSHTLL